MLDFLMMQDASEIVRYDEIGFPLYISFGRLSDFPNMRALSHWHEDIECMLILSGEMSYDVNGRRVILRAGDSLIINSKEMHYGYDFGKKECEFVCILFHPSLFKANELFYNRFVLPLINNTPYSYLHFTNSQADGVEMAAHLKRIYDLKIKGVPGYQINAYSEVFNVLSLIYRKMTANVLKGLNEPKDENVEIQKVMVSFVHEHFFENITLDEIAASANVSRSKCCHIFSKYLGQSPIDFLNAYRLEVSRNLLKNTDSRITQIAISCGFNHPSYFAEIFKKTYGETPRSYRDSTK